MEEPIDAEFVDVPPILPPLIERRWVVICTMVFCALFLAFPLLWRSRQFSAAGKVFWTAFVLVETVLLCWLVWWAIANLIATLRDVGIM